MNAISQQRPDLHRVPAFYHNYIRQAEGSDLIQLLQDQQQAITEFFRSIPGDRWNTGYAPGKWSIKDLVQHMIDTERIFCYRALRFARNDATELAGFDENNFAQQANAGRRSKDALLEELAAVQQASLLLFQSFDEEQLEAAGTANGNRIYVRAIGFIIAGHALHHKKVVQDRYLQQSSVGRNSQ
jgi:hypothetical protein